MKKIILGTSLLVSSLTLAESLRIEIGENTKDVSVPSYVLKCKDVGREKLISQAEAFGVEIDLNTFRVSGTSSNLYTKYVWWSVDVSDVNGRSDIFPKGKKAVLQKITQKPLGRPCF